MVNSPHKAQLALQPGAQESRWVLFLRAGDGYTDTSPMGEEWVPEEKVAMGAPDWSAMCTKGNPAGSLVMAESAK